MSSQERRKAPTLRDIAENAGVSLFTASVVLNGSRSNTRVSPVTRQRIQEVAHSLGYYPNAMARGLARRRLNTVGVLFGMIDPIGALTNPYSGAVLEGIVAAAFPFGNNVTLYGEPWQDTPQNAARFRDGRTDGIIVVAPTSESTVVERLTALHIPLVTVAYCADTFGVPSVDVDNVAGITLACAHLLDLGHRRIAHLTGNADMVSVPVRRQAFEEAMARGGGIIEDGYVHVCAYSGDHAGEAVAALLSLPHVPTAIVAGNDAIAIAAMRAAQERGVRVPEDLSIIGFDDSPSAALVTPGLTTIRQPVREIGGKALGLLLDRIDNKDVPARTYLMEPELIVRGSTSPLPGGRPIKGENTESESERTSK
ncbi:MAG: LacI family DNA-binding transcriptional regulator [Capsulimonadales bacterium]|nr:LacI family DNA-binding transcriptional regulator [Capsulimonadales bacterium]